MTDPARRGPASADRGIDHPFFASFEPGRVLIHGHQGGDLVWPGNTMLAFREAVALGVDALELDVHLSADGEVVVLHDDTVDRTTDGSGRVAGLALAELRRLDAAHRWRPPDGPPDSYPYRGRDLAIPTLREVFEAFPDTPIIVELKPKQDRLAVAVCELVRERCRERVTLVASYHQAMLRAFRAGCPEVATSAALPEGLVFRALNSLCLAGWFAPRFQALQVPVRYRGLAVATPWLIAGALERNLHVDVWTVNDADEMRSFADLGVLGIVTDRPDLALRVLRA